MAEGAASEDRRKLRDRLRIDPLRLDEALVEHSSLVNRVGRETARAQSVLDQQKDALARLEAELAVRVRKRLGRVQNRVTEAEVREQLLTDTEFQQAHNRVLTAKREHGLWEALQEAFKQRSFMLRSLVDLYTADYYNTQADSITRGARWAKHVEDGAEGARKYFRNRGASGARKT